MPYQIKKEQHIARHNFLHKALDELTADYITHHSGDKQPSNTTVMELMQWSAKQKENPCEREGLHDDSAL